MTAINTGKLPGFRVAAQRQRLFDDGGKILVVPDMLHFGVGYHSGGEHPVGIAAARRHQAVGGEQDGSRNIRKFPGLILPCSTEITLEVGILFQLRVGMGRQHFAVRIDVDALSFGLLQQQL